MAENYSAGEIIPKETANEDFGMASFSSLMSSAQIKSIASKTQNLLMFNFIDDKLIILGDYRKPLYPERIIISADTIFKVYSKAKVLELISTGGNDNNFIELRADKITITNGDYTLEFGSLCPPWCSV
jgi:hypothetical protein